MKNFGKWALCLLVCVAFLALPAIAEHPWEDKGLGEGEGGPPANPGTNSSYNGMPLLLDGDPWDDDPGNGGGNAKSPFNAVGPSSWWLQPALDYHTWGEDPPKRSNQTP